MKETKQETKQTAFPKSSCNMNCEVTLHSEVHCFTCYDYVIPGVTMESICGLEYTAGKNLQVHRTKCPSTSDLQSM